MTKEWIIQNTGLGNMSVGSKEEIKLGPQLNYIPNKF